ncbi:MAG: hypothetical protein WEB06_12740 [Actinomycetota bacterium]
MPEMEGIEKAVLCKSRVGGVSSRVVAPAYLGMEMIGEGVIGPVAVATLATGLVMSLGAKWGLFRHYWVLISLIVTVIATIVLLIELSTIGQFADLARAPTTPVAVSAS